MANTYTLISSNVLSSSAASVTFSSIPSTYTDLVLRFSSRTSRTSVYDQIKLTFNGDTATNYSDTYVFGDGATAYSGSDVSSNYSLLLYSNGDSATASTFGQGELYIPNYAGSAKKPSSSFIVAETNATTQRMGVNANLWQGTAAITSVTFTPFTATNFLSGSSFYLYGIKNS
jgi:hypothetical protein